MRDSLFFFMRRKENKKATRVQVACKGITFLVINPIFSRGLR